MSVRMVHDFLLIQNLTHYFFTLKYLTKLNNMEKYRIEEGIYKNEYGVEERRVYYILKRKTFLGFEYWKYQTHEICGWGDCYDVRTEFSSPHDAHQFAKKNLCGGNFKEGWSYKVINEFECNK